MLSDYKSDPAVTAMMDAVTFVVFPVLNADGYAYSWTNVSIFCLPTNNLPLQYIHLSFVF